jgi:hypothetical protein
MSWTHPVPYCPTTRPMPEAPVVASHVFDGSALNVVLAVLMGWLDRRERQALAYLMEEDRILRRQFGQQRILFTDADRRRLARRGNRLGRQVLRQMATIVTPDTIAMASAAHRAEVDVPKQPCRPPGCARRDSPPGCADGGREPHLGVHANPRRPQECGASRGPLDNRPNSQSPRRPAGAGAPDIVADLSEGALGRDRRCRFLHGGGVDLAGLGDLGSCPSVIAISGGPSKNSSSIIIGDGIIKASRIALSKEVRPVDPPARFVGASGSAAC